MEAYNNREGFPEYLDCIVVPEHSKVFVFMELLAMDLDEWGRRLYVKKILFKDRLIQYKSLSLAL